MTGSDVEQLESRDRPRGHCRVGEGACHRPCEVAAAGPIDRRGGQGAEPRDTGLGRGSVRLTARLRGARRVKLRNYFWNFPFTPFRPQLAETTESETAIWGVSVTKLSNRLPLLSDNRLL